MLAWFVAAVSSHARLWSLVARLHRVHRRRDGHHAVLAPRRGAARRCAPLRRKRGRQRARAASRREKAVSLRGGARRRVRLLVLLRLLRRGVAQREQRAAVLVGPQRCGQRARRVVAGDADVVLLAAGAPRAAPPAAQAVLRSARRSAKARDAREPSLLSSLRAQRTSPHTSHVFGMSCGVRSTASARPDAARARERRGIALDTAFGANCSATAATRTQRHGGAPEAHALARCAACAQLRHAARALEGSRLRRKQVMRRGGASALRSPKRAACEPLRTASPAAAPGGALAGARRLSELFSAEATGGVKKAPAAIRFTAAAVPPLSLSRAAPRPTSAVHAGVCAAAPPAASAAARRASGASPAPSAGNGGASGASAGSQSMAARGSKRKPQ